MKTRSKTSTLSKQIITQFQKLDYILHEEGENSTSLPLTIIMFFPFQTVNKQFIGMTPSSYIPKNLRHQIFPDPLSRENTSRPSRNFNLYDK